MQGQQEGFFFFFVLVNLLTILEGKPTENVYLLHLYFTPPSSAWKAMFELHDSISTYKSLLATDIVAETKILPTNGYNKWAYQSLKSYLLMCIGELINHHAYYNVHNPISSFLLFFPFAFLGLNVVSNLSSSTELIPIKRDFVFCHQHDVPAICPHFWIYGQTKLKQQTYSIFNRSSYSWRQELTCAHLNGVK